MFLLSRTPYPSAGYSHQGWLTKDKRFFLMNDELDEVNLGVNTRTHIWDVADLTRPVYRGFYAGRERTIDHNMFIKGGYLYQANYTSGLRVLDIAGIAGGKIREVAFFDTYPTDNAVSFNGAWSVYPFFDSGTILVNDRQNGLFVLRLAPFL